MSDRQHDAAIRSALGRIFLLGSRPFQAGDLEQYEACRRVILDCSGHLPDLPDFRQNWARDRNRGASGD